MKNIRKTLTLVTLILFTFASSTYSSGYANDIARTDDEAYFVEKPTVQDDDDCYFIYWDTKELAWFNQSFDAKSCSEGYLYVKDNKGVVSLVWKNPLSSFVRVDERIFAIDLNKQLIEILSKDIATTLYSTQNGSIDKLTYSGTTLYFVDGETLVSYDIVQKQWKTITECKNISLLTIEDDNTVVWQNTDEETFEYNLLSGTRTSVQREDLLADAFCEDHSHITTGTIETTPSRAASAPVTFPLSNYQVGSFFTLNGKECSVHNEDCSYTGGCNCKPYSNSIQCMGFAKYASDQYANRSGFSYVNEDTSWTVRYMSSADVAKTFYKNLTYGTYVRVSTTNSSGGTHSIVIAGTSATGITIYEGNYDGNCRVNKRTVTYEQLRTQYPYVTCVMEHDFTGTKSLFSAKYHKIACASSGCTGYKLGSHYASNVGGATNECAVCGYVGNFSGGLA